MTSSTESESSEKNKLKVLASISHAGSLIEHVAVSSADALSDLIQRCNREGRRLVPGRPGKLPPSPANRFDYFVGLNGADSVIEHCRPDQVISVQAGISIKALQALLAQHKQWFPVYVADEEISLMEYINGGSSGPLEHGYGEARDLVLGMQVVLGSGELIKCGGKVVKNVTGYDLPKLFCGSFGSLAFPFSAHLRLYALPETSSTLLLSFSKQQDAFAAARALRRSGLPLSCLELVDAGIQICADENKFKFPVSSSDTAAFLCAQIHGISSVVAELEKELIEIAGKSALHHNKLASEQAAELWKFIARPHANSEIEWVEIAGPVRALEQVLADLKKSSPDSFTWTARPALNKAILLLNSKSSESKSGSKSGSGVENASRSEPESGSAGVPPAPTPSQDLINLINQTESTLKQCSEKATIAYSDSLYLWKIRVLPEEDAVLNELKHRLKLEYDPHDVLNPLVSL